MFRLMHPYRALHTRTWLVRVLRLGYLASLVLAFWLALQPVSELPIQDFNDKLAHALGLGALTLAAGVLYPAWRAGFTGMLLMGYGLAIELAQATIPWRSASVGDAVADAIGVLFAVWLLRYRPRIPISRTNL